MCRRFLLKFLQRSILATLLVCLGCSAQSTPPDLAKRIEAEVRTYYKLPGEVAISVGDLKPSSEFPNYDAVVISFANGARQDHYQFLVSKDRKTLIRVTRLDISQDPYAKVMKKIDIAGRPVRGNKNARVVAVNFDDFECPFCAHMHATLFPELLKEYGDRVAFVYKDFPLAEIHPWAVHAAVDANCLAAQSSDAYWDFADYVHGDPNMVNDEKGLPAQFAALDRITMTQGQNHHLDQSKLAACVKAQDDSAVEASIHEGEALGVEATPTMFVNGEEVDGALPISQLRTVFDNALKRAGVSPPDRPTEAKSSPQALQK
jgi:protein-disulfide isomerase